MSQLPECGLYRTSQTVAGIEAETLVYFHNHGEPGPGLYLPQSWKNNQAEFSKQGKPLEDTTLAHTLEPLIPEGLYRVAHPFHCCKNKCVHFNTNQLLQLGYDGKATAILFVPFWQQTELNFPPKGTLVDSENLQNLELLELPRSTSQAENTLH